MKKLLVLALALFFIPTFSFATEGLMSRIFHGTSNQVCTSFVDEVKIEKRMVRSCDGCCLKFECKDVAVTYRKKVWIEKVPIIECVDKTVCVNECVCVQQCINGCNCLVPTTIQKQVVVKQPTVVGYQDKIIKTGIPHKVCETFVVNPVSTVAPPLAY
jgi:hypothetical protein